MKTKPANQTVSNAASVTTTGNESVVDKKKIKTTATITPSPSTNSSQDKISTIESNFFKYRKSITLSSLMITAASLFHEKTRVLAPMLATASILLVNFGIIRSGYNKAVSLNEEENTGIKDTLESDSTTISDEEAPPVVAGKIGTVAEPELEYAQSAA